MRNLIKTTGYFTNRTGISSIYLNEIRDFVILDEKEIINLLRKYKEGDRNSLNELVKSYQRFILSFAKRFSKNDESLLFDLISEGNIGLLKCVDCFDFAKKNKFLTYAVWYIQKYMFMYLAKVDPMITISNYNKTSTKIKKITNNFLLENGRVPDSLELIDIIKEKHDIDVKDESDVYQLDISSITSEDGEYDLSYKTNSMCSENDYNSTIDSDFSKQTIDSLMVFLKPKEKEVIKLLFGIDSFRPLELYEVAQQLNMTDDGIKCIKVRALSKMKNNIKNINV